MEKENQSGSHEIVAPEENVTSVAEPLEEEAARIVPEESSDEASRKPVSRVAAPKKKKSLVKRVFSVIGNLIFIALIAIAIFLASTMIFGERDPGGGVSIFGIRMYSVLTPSMVPTYPPGTLVVVKETPAAEIRPGDVISFSVAAEQAVLTHRVVEVRQRNTSITFVTKGDANEINDPNPVSSVSVFGVALFGIPFLGSLLDFLKNGIGVVLLIVVPMLLVIVVQLVKLIRYSKKTQ